MCGRQNRRAVVGWITNRGHTRFTVKERGLNRTVTGHYQPGRHFQFCIFHICIFLSILRYYASAVTFITRTPRFFTPNGIMMKLKHQPALRKVINHGIWWFCYVIYELSIYYYAIGVISDMTKTLLFYGLNITLFYCHLALLNKTLGSDRNRYFGLMVLLTAELCFFVALKIILDLLYAKTELPQFKDWGKIKPIAILDLQRSLFFVGLSSLYWAASNLSGYERRAREAEIGQLKTAKDALALQAELTRSENALLRQQINPHLLFNSLNFIHSTVYQVSEKAAETVIMLADILRFSMAEAGEDGKIRLKDEIEQIRNLIDINTNRFQTTSRVNFTVSGHPENSRIIPLVLITLVENIFKHGNFMEQEATIRLEISGTGLLRFYTGNALKAAAPYPRLKSTGLQNIRIRLDYAYGDTYKLETQVHDRFFESKLILQL